MLAVGNDELGQRVNEGDEVESSSLKLKGIIGNISSDSGRVSLGIIKVGDKDYLVAINGRLIKDWRVA